jgi:hypothetical protein
MIGLLTDPSVKERTERTSSDSPASERKSSSLKTSLLLDEELYVSSDSRALSDPVASSRPFPSSLSNRVWSAVEASGGGGLVHLLRFGAICSGGEGVETCLRLELRGLGSKNLVVGDKRSGAEPFGRKEELPTVYGV